MSAEERNVLAYSDAAEARTAHADASVEFLHPRVAPANVVGLGVGVKWSGGEPTGEPALIALVTSKVSEQRLRAADVIPKQLAGMQTDVLAVGAPVAGATELPKPKAEILARRTRPAMGGHSVGHSDITAGTIATCAYKILPGGSATQPYHGAGLPRDYYILSNNHVLANSNRARVGDAILQPGSHDGGRAPADQVATLSRFVPISFDPPVPRAAHYNLVDAAIARADINDISREVYWGGYVRGWRPIDKVAVGTPVKKTGRTTHFTTGRVTATNVTIDVSYRIGGMARFTDQILTTHLSEGGDSGSLIMSSDNVAVGLLFAGSDKATIANQIEHVRALLEVEVAEQPM